MTDCKNLDLAREWAEWVKDNPEVYGGASGRARGAAADLISSLPDEWVDADTLREVVADHHIDMSEELMEALGDLLPATPRTMDEIEWDDDEHHLAEATAAWTEGNPSKVVMLNKFDKKITVYQSAPHYSGLRELNPGILAPTGRKYRLEPDESIPKGGPVETEFDPDYIYTDRDGETWEYLDGKWVQGDSRTDRLVSLNVNHGLNNLLPKYGPYTRIEDTK